MSKRQQAAPADHPGSRIRERRLALGIGQGELADRAGVHRSSIVDIEAGRMGKQMGAKLAYDIAKVLRWRVEDVMGLPRLYPVEEAEDTP